MGAMQRIKHHFRFSLDNWALRHDDASDFYLSCWQRNRSALPLLCVRLFLFLASLGILTFSLVLTVRRAFMAYWAIYMTQWALVGLNVSTGLATLVSAVAYFGGPIDSTSGLPWYVRLHWVAYCTMLPIAFNTTIFYYSLLTGAAPDDVEINRALDVLIHGINSVIMFLLLVTSRQPIYFFQCIFGIGLIIAYVIFNVIYYFAGGTDPFGNHAIYPMVDWTKPGLTIGVLFLVIGIIIVSTILAVVFTLLRDLASRKCISPKAYAIG